jgi:SulP family sulfate permease
MKLNFKPKLFTTLKNYNKELFYADLMAGVIVGIVALPLAIAFGIASGVRPEQGLITAIIAGFLISFFGGSKVQIGGPTGAFIVIVFGIISEFGHNGLIVATLMAGIILILLGVFKLGSVIKFVPYPVIVGFTSGIALTIFTTQIKDLFGLEMTEIPGDFIHKWIAYGQSIASINYWSMLVAVATILIIVYMPKISKKIPGAFVAIIVITVIVYFIRTYVDGAVIETIGDKFKIDPSLPTPETPKVTFSMIQMLLPAAFTIAMLGAIESLLSAMVADGVTGDKHDSNTELIGQGIANVIVPFFGGIPATGAIARTMTNINNGGKTPVAGIIHAVVLLLIMLFLGSLTKHIPMACLAGVLAVVSYNMSEWRNFKMLLKNPKSDVAVLLVTFFLTVVFDLTIAIEIGLLLAVLLFLKRITETTNISVIQNEIKKSETEEEVNANDTGSLIIPEGVEVYEISGPFFFGVANKFNEQIRIVAEKPKVRIIRMRKVPFIDSTGLHNLRNLYKLSKKEGIQIILSGVNKNVEKTFISSGFINEIGKENVCPDINEALKKAKLVSNG